MSVRVMTAVWAMDLAAKDKLVLLALADCANDEGLAWPSIATLARKCGCDERTVQRNLRTLEAREIIRREEAIGKGNRFYFNPRQIATPGKTSPVTKRTKTPGKSPPKPSRTVNTSPKTRVRKALHPMPANWEPVLTATAQRIVDGWPPGRYERVLAAFRDHAADKGRLSKDWQAAFRTWLSKDEQWNPTDARSARQSNDNRRTGGSTRAAAEQALARLQFGG